MQYDGCRAANSAALLLEGASLLKGIPWCQHFLRCNDLLMDQCCSKASIVIAEIRGVSSADAEAVLHVGKALTRLPQEHCSYKEAKGF